MTQETVAEKITAHDLEIDALKRRMDNAESVITEVHDIATSVKLLAQESKNTGDKVDKISDKIELLEKKPGEEWAKLKTAIVTCICTAIITACIAAVMSIL